MIQDTSLQTYIEEKKKLSERETIVYNAFREYGEMTAKEMQKQLKYIDGNMIKPRITELCKKEILERKGKRKDNVPPNKQVYVFGIK